MKRREFLTYVPALAATPYLVRPAFAAPVQHVVEMTSDVFLPDFLEVAVGDTIQFVNTKGSHNTESIAGMIPDGVKPWRSRMKQTFDLTIDQPGVYGYKCTPHFNKGMVGLIVAGDPTVNLSQAMAVNNPRRAQAAFDRLLGRAQAIAIVPGTSG